MKSLIADKLKQYSFESQWLDTIYDVIKKVLSAPLEPVLEDIKLSSIQNNERLNEVEFYFPLKTISPEKINWIFHQKGFKNITPAETIGRLKFSPTKGFMKGFMDLVFQWHDRFYLVDWKSNFLGDRIEDYGQESLELAMKKEFYVLQYHIYTLALDQYLNLRLPNYSYEKHFGGVFYIFLRGVDPKSGPDYGIYRDLPSPELIGVLREELIP
jgi:exodeoxyribonuclease V beta subunit